MRVFLYQFNFAIRALLRRKIKNISIILMFALVVLIFASIHFLSGSLNRETDTALEYQPEIIVQNLKAGRQLPLPLSWAEDIGEIIGVSEARPRVWGFYFDRYTGANYTIVGIPPELMEEEDPSLGCLVPSLGAREVAVGEGVMTSRGLEVGGRIQLERPDGTPIRFTATQSFISDVVLWTYDLVAMPSSDARDLFDLPEDEAWDIAVYVPNPVEVANVSQKVLNMFPGARIVVKDQLISSYGTMFGFRNGLLITISLSCLLAFFILAYDRAAGLPREEQMEIAILKALGWETRDVIRVNMLQSVVISLTAFLAGVIGAYIY
ncbi:MAG TPA: FtsX-like permease family protein, partial [Deltaproteobacteria bacterium]|nr:FtsX-like permease family protein [Deltaproteobacteria bacterium]